MYRYDDLVRGLLVVIGRPGRESPAAKPEDLQHTLAPLVRLALRRGAGAPPLVRWVRQTLTSVAGPTPAAPESYAPQITRLLCAALLEQERPGPSRPRAQDTLVGV